MAVIEKIYVALQNDVRNKPRSKFLLILHNSWSAINRIIFGLDMQKQTHVVE